MTTYLLLPQQAWGFFALLFLFLFCFAGVHILRLAELGFKQVKTPPPPPKEEKNEPPKSKEPVYYYVRKKRE